MTVKKVFFPVYCSLSRELGSGEFGVVYLGKWRPPKGEEIEVAVKTLKEGSTEQDRVKFLQEAAIMGQFKHPNVVRMYGVITEGEPVSSTDRIIMAELWGQHC